ncbi:MAG: PAS domain S-box protein [Desulfobacula sp.]|jgi:two-component system cell cycle sensor histidine kinase/response regulator CckA|nr:PAS domain S-box protein [Desulfobacula sp.]
MVEIPIDQIFEDIVETIREPLLVLDSDLKVISASRSFYKVFKVKPEETVGQLIYDLGNKQWDIPKLRDLLETILPQKTTFDDYEVEHDFADIGKRIMLLNARQIKRAWGKERIILLAIEDITDRKQLEDVLTESVERYRRVFKTATDGILLFEKGGLIIRHANPTIEAMLGYSKEELVSKDLKDIGFPDDMGSYQEIMQTLNTVGIVHYRDARIKKKTGEIIDTDIYMVDKTSLVQCNVRDITRQKQMKETLKKTLWKSERKYRLIAEHMADVISIMDMDLRFTYVSPSVMRLRGFTVEEAMEQTIDQIMTPGSLQLISQVFDEELRLETTETAAPDRARIVELEEYKKDGSTIWVENTSSFIRDEGQKPVGILTVSRDITERKQAEESLRASKEKFQSMVDNLAIGVSLISPTMEILELNRQMHAWYPDIDPSVRPICYQAFNNPPRDEICDHCPTYRTIQDGNMHEGTVVKPTPEGPRSYRIISSPIFSEQGSVTAAIEIVEDITERISLENQLRQAQKMESVGRLAGGVAHDYNNVLSVIIGFTELAIEQVDPTGPLCADLEEVLSAANRATDITRQLLAFARKQVIKPKVLDLNGNVGSMLKMLRRLIGEDIDLVWRPMTNLWSVKIDPTQIDQILANLCVNARDAIKDVGKITIETGIKVFDADYCADHADYIPGEFVMLAVSDNGCGMHKETLDNIFDPFFTTKDVHEGTGLGLATVHGIVKQNQGFINIYSEPDNGTIFKLYFPRHEGKAVEIQEEITEEIPKGLGETILLVEDDDSILKLAQKILDGLGYNVLIADTPTEAIRVAEKHVSKVNLLITDVIMPEMNGLDLTERLKSVYPDLKCMFMSGYTADIIAHHGVLEEGVHFIQKPFSKRDLAQTVRKSLDE